MKNNAPKPGERLEPGDRIDLTKPIRLGETPTLFALQGRCGWAESPVGPLVMLEFALEGPAAKLMPSIRVVFTPDVSRTIIEQLTKQTADAEAAENAKNEKKNS